MLTGNLTSFKHFGGIECEVCGAPSLLAAAIDIMSLVAWMCFTLEARSIDQILILHTTKTDKI